MKEALEWLAITALCIGTVCMAALVVLLAALPYAAVVAVLLVCARYLGWF